MNLWLLGDNARNCNKTHPRNVQGLRLQIHQVNKVIEEVESRAKAEGKLTNICCLAHLVIHDTSWMAVLLLAEDYQNFKGNDSDWRHYIL